jgi:DNA-binding SARP family transcriptional activator/tetratricopeptide (TPR) repeat protein
MEARLLGPVEVLCGGGRADLGHGKELSLLAALLVQVDTPVPVDRLLDLLWDGDPPSSGRASLQVHVSRLRSRLARAGADLRIVTRGATYAAQAEPAIVDLHRFRRLVDDARRASQPKARAALLGHAVALWRGPPLANVEAAVRDRLGPGLEEELLAAVEQRVDAELALGRHAAQVATLAELVAAHPFRERLVGLLMLALYRSGRQADALARYRAFTHRIVDEHGTDPGPELATLHQRILHADPALGAPTAGAPTTRNPSAQDPVGDAPRILPSPPRHFAGRRSEEAELTAALLPAADEATAVRTAVLSGGGGAGKTSLALHWAQQHAGWFPDGQLYVNLRGFDPVAEPKESAVAVGELLVALGVEPAKLPADPDALAALYRGRLAGRDVLVVLDNARHGEQVRPLLPGSPSCAVVVTSRNPLAGLVAAEGAHPVPVGVLSDADGHQLLARRLGAARVAAEGGAVESVLRVCARLPLALALVAARLAAAPELRLAAVAAELDRRSGGLDAFACDDPAVDVRSVFSWSVRTLTAPAARLFRLLGLHAGPDVTVAAAASLAGLGTAATGRLVRELCAAQLLTEPTPGRYAMHELLVSYARELDQAHGTAAETAAARDRLLHHYLHTALAASGAAFPVRHPLRHPAPPDGVTIVTPADRTAALAWFDADRAAVLAAVDRAATAGPDPAWRLAWLATTFLDRAGRWRDIVAMQGAVLDAARRDGDLRALAYAHRGLCRAHTLLAHPDRARRHAEEALRAYTAVGDTLGMAAVQYDASIAHWRDDDLGRAAAAGEEALRLYRAAGYLPGQADALNATGWYCCLLGDYERALRCCEEALELQAGADNAGGQAATLDSLGHIHHRLGDLGRAIECYQRALVLQNELGDAFEESMVLVHLGDAHHARQDPGPAAEAWRRAHAILVELGHPDAADVSRKLAALA